jgi:microcystin degradation protein MlrC
VRALVLKSRGHFRAAFDEFFADEQIVEVDVPGLTTPVLANVAWQHMPRPIYPIDPDTDWRGG